MILACSRAPLQCNRRYMGSTAILEVPRTFVDFAEHTANQGSRSPHRKRDKACAPAMLDRLTQAQVSASGSWSGAATASAWTHRGPPPACPPAFLVIWSVFKPPLPPLATGDAISKCRSNLDFSNIAHVERARMASPSRILLEVDRV